MVGISDIAKKAGVSTGTVSRVMNGHSNVSDEARRNVLKWMKELEYIPNETARKLGMLRGKRKEDGKPARTNQVACVLFANFNKYSTPYFSGILDGIDSELFKKEYQLSIYTTAQLNSSPVLFSKVIDPEKIDGLILISAGEIAPKARERVKPIVCVNFMDDGYDSLDVDRERGVYDAVTYLAGLGHRKIAFVGRDRNQNLVDKKFSGYCRALAEAGIEYKESLVTGTGYGIETGYAALKEIRAQNAAPTAVFAASDMTAFGVMKAAGELGLKVPDDLSLIGYDDIEPAQITFPPLTTVRVDKQYLGTLCARRLLERIGDPAMKPVKTIIPTELIIRSSCRGLAG